jgi:predicted transcriptional regulator
MTTRKITSVVDEAAWDDLRTLAKESNQSISVVLTEAIREYMQRRPRTRADVLRHLEESLLDNEELGRLLAR